MTNDALAPIRQLQIGVLRQKRGELRLDGLLDQPLRAGTQDFREWIVDCAFLFEGDNIFLGYGVTLLREVRAGLVTDPVTQPSSRSHHPLSAIAHSKSLDVFGESWLCLTL
ncbi:hypothetical protein MSC49_42350 (plasmid) [Methylosinus sp. C49]|nr:hypothetical protein MSC49_42350 [Methylosinus sp. C49]